ncbi:TPA: DnaD domain protein [Streptococcus equi subsp. equi]|nr:DnaD domain protein [Streptococcus equi subsp. equi]HEK9220296.1 DnaD domain protein [Streptococcus equi subsp. equi]HEK9243832.1 DnaD domain protein [Streptococcus equi subsp. equi]
MDEKKLFENFQLTFGRMISPFEIEDIQKWIHEDNMPIDVVNLALREAVENNKINWKYINKILVEWHKAGDTTIEKVKERLQRFEDSKEQRQATISNVPSWSNPDYQGPTYDDLKVNPSEVSDGAGDF